MGNFSEFKRFQELLNCTIIGIDHGSQVIGLSIFTPGKEPYPIGLGRIVVKDDKNSIQEISTFVDDEAAEIIVVGLPIYTDGKESEMTHTVRSFIEKLRCHLPNIKVYEQDETLTSYEAENRMKNSPAYNFKVDRTKIDEVAATIILEDFIRS